MRNRRVSKSVNGLPGAFRQQDNSEFRCASALESKNFVDRLSREDKYSLSVDVLIHIGVTNFIGGNE